MTPRKRGDAPCVVWRAPFGGRWVAHCWRGCSLLTSSTTYREAINVAARHAWLHAQAEHKDEHMSAELYRTRRERDRARDVAVALEQELAEREKAAVAAMAAVVAPREPAALLWRASGIDAPAVSRG